MRPSLSGEIGVSDDMDTMKFTPGFFNDLSIDYLPAHHGIWVTKVKPGELQAKIQVKKSLLAQRATSMRERL